VGPAKVKSGGPPDAWEAPSDDVVVHGGSHVEHLHRGAMRMILPLSGLPKREERSTKAGRSILPLTP